MGETGVAEPLRNVQVSPFFMDSVPVTQGAWRALMGSNPSHFTGNDSLPVETVSWFEAARFCNARSRAEKRDTVYVFTAPDTARIRYDVAGYRLPNEAEYEYAQRAGTTTDFYWGDSLDADYCWYFANADNKTHPVGRLRPNAFGLYDMSGNLWEWCNDWYAPYDPAQVRDPAGPDTGSYRIVRGGSWYTYYPIILGSAFRHYLEPAPRFHPPRDYYGFRCVLPAR